MSHFNVAIDGPAGAGKSSISKEVSKRLGCIYVDTGAMYRASALYAINNNIPITKEALEPVLDDIKIDIVYKEDGQRIILNEEDVSSKIREPEVSIGASDIATIPCVRLKLVDLQRKIAKNNNVIMDGRDIGTYVLPEANVKIFLTASVDERAKRRVLEFKEKGQTLDIDKVKEDIKYRDKNDSEREFAPLKQAADAILLDTTELNFNEAVLAVLDIINKSNT